MLAPMGLAAMLAALVVPPGLAADPDQLHTRCAAAVAPAPPTPQPPSPPPPLPAIVLLNLLIAILTDSYSRINERTEGRFRAAQVRRGPCLGQGRQGKAGARG
jgi:hypothetical protein